MAQSQPIHLKLLIAGILLFLPVSVSAATIYGTIYSNNQPLPNAELRFDCWNGAPVKTDERGSYRVSVSHIGRCNLSIGNATGLVIFYQEPTRYDFDFLGNQLRRR
jgi:hypothetical protein